MSDARIRRLIEDDRGPRKLFEVWLSDHSSVLTTLLAGNTLVNIIASAMVTSLALDLSASGHVPGWMANSTVGIGVFCLTMLILVWGEITPKTLAKGSPERFLKPLWLVWWLHVPTHRVTGGLTWLARRIIESVGVDADKNGFIVTEEQIEDMVRIGSEEGSIEADRGEILQNVFDLWEVSVRSIMTPRTQVRSLPIDATLEEVLEAIAETSFSRYPVYDGSADEIAGIFYTKSLISYLEKTKRKAFNLANHLADPMFVPETQKASNVLQEFKTRAVHMAIVVDEHGGTAGILTLEDVLEELVGEIYDEHDEVERIIEPFDDNVWVIDASAEVREIEEQIELKLPESETYSTLGGFLVEQFGKVPDIGDEYTWQHVHFKILEANDKRPLRVQVLWRPETKQANSLDVAV
jgi:putative hemolysin